MMHYLLSVLKKGFAPMTTLDLLSRSRPTKKNMVDRGLATPALLILDRLKKMCMVVIIFNNGAYNNN
jgi:hypothetical protein